MQIQIPSLLHLGPWKEQLGFALPSTVSFMDDSQPDGKLLFMPSAAGFWVYSLNVDSDQIITIEQVKDLARLWSLTANRGSVQIRTDEHPEQARQFTQLVGYLLSRCQTSVDSMATINLANETQPIRLWEHRFIVNLPQMIQKLDFDIDSPNLIWTDSRGGISPALSTVKLAGGMWGQVTFSDSGGDVHRIGIVAIRS